MLLASVFFCSSLQSSFTASCLPGHHLRIPQSDLSKIPPEVIKKFLRGLFNDFFSEVHRKFFYRIPGKLLPAILLEFLSTLIWKLLSAFLQEIMQMFLWDSSWSPSQNFTAKVSVRVFPGISQKTACKAPSEIISGAYLSIFTAKIRFRISVFLPK